jgi:imidazole glycerol phosphate synthase glutamine amidotransferase subunit
MRIGLVDYGAGNQQSVRNALRSLGLECARVAGPAALDGIDTLIFPGVGAFGDTMRHLHERGLSGPLREWIRGGRPFLGICIGYQVLFDSSVESPGVPGLSVFPGTVVELDAPGLKIPHMGWNSVRLHIPSDPLWHGLGPSPHFYFVHSFHPVPADPALVAATTDYGASFPSAIRWPAGAAVQFHPEKSQTAGLELLRNFVDLSRQALDARSAVAAGT